METKDPAPSFKTLNEWLAWLEQAHPVDTIELGLDRVKQVAKLLLLDNPEPPVITVAGTNGKGSVIATLEALAKSHNLKIASYTSPHLLVFNERIRINGIPVEDELIVDAFIEIEKVRFCSGISLTYFEYTTLVALYIFKHTQLDFIALEVGLGGRLDAVNIIDCDLAVITSIGLDHTDWLGDNLKAIAEEKAGIMRQGKKVVLADNSLQDLLAEKLQSLNAQALVEGIDYHISQTCHSWSLQSGQSNWNGLMDSNLYIPNLAAALVAFQQVFTERYSQDSISQAMKQITNIGRFQVLSDAPKLILDVAHNPDSATLLNKKIKQSQLQNEGATQTWAICGMLQDKDIKATLSELTCVDRWLCLDLGGSRGASGKEVLANIALTAGKSGEIFGKIDDAVNYFKKHHQEGDQLIVFGSFLTVSAMLQYWQKEELKWTTN